MEKFLLSGSTGRCDYAIVPPGLVKDAAYEIQRSAPSGSGPVASKRKLVLAGGLAALSG